MKKIIENRIDKIAQENFATVDDLVNMTKLHAEENNDKFEQKILALVNEKLINLENQSTSKENEDLNIAVTKLREENICLIANLSELENMNKQLKQHKISHEEENEKLKAEILESQFTNSLNIQPVITVSTNKRFSVRDSAVEQKSMEQANNKSGVVNNTNGKEPVENRNTAPNKLNTPDLYVEISMDSHGNGMRASQLS